MDGEGTWGCNKKLPIEKYTEGRHYLIFHVMLQVTSAPAATNHKQCVHWGAASKLLRWAERAVQEQINGALAQNMLTTTHGQSVRTTEQHPSLSPSREKQVLAPPTERGPSIWSSQNKSQGLGSKSHFCTLRRQSGTVRMLLAGTCTILVFSGSLFSPPASPPHLPQTPHYRSNRWES